LGLDAEITMCPRSVDDAIVAQMLASVRVTPIGGPQAWLLHHRADLAGLWGTINRQPPPPMRARSLVTPRSGERPGIPARTALLSRR